VKLPRNIDGHQLAKALGTLGYEITRQKGSHLRITTELGGQHHEVIPAHRPLNTGTLASILKSVAAHHGISAPQLIQKLKLR